MHFGSAQTFISKMEKGWGNSGDRGLVDAIDSQDDGMTAKCILYSLHNFKSWRKSKHQSLYFCVATNKKY